MRTDAAYGCRSAGLNTLLPLRLLAREWRSGELGILLLALSIAVAALTGVGFLVDRIDSAIELQSREVLAADIRVGASDPLPPDYFAEAQRRGLRTAQTTYLLSVVFQADHSQLANIRAVTKGYPLRGKIMLADAAFATGAPTDTIPGPGEVWPDSRLMAALDAHIGSEIAVGSATLRVTRVLISRPDQGGSFSDLAPSLLMSAADLAATQLVQPASRVRYIGLFAGDSERTDRERVAAFKAWLTAHKQRGERIFDVEEASPQIHNAVDRAGRFLSLASLVSVLLAAIAVAMSARRYVQRHLDSVALLKTLGATRAFTVFVSVLQLVVIAVLATLAGSAVGYVVQQWLLHALRGLFTATVLPAAGFAPLLTGFFAASAVLGGFALPPLLQLARVPAIRVLRRDIGPPPPLIVLAFGPAVLVVLALIYWIVRDARLFAQISGGLVVFLALLAAGGLLLVQIAGRLRGSVGVSWRYGVANLSRRRSESVLQIVAFGTGLMILLALGLVRGDLLADWRKALPVEAPNYFFINIPATKRAEFVDFLRTHGAATSRVLPMIRGRLTQIRGEDVDAMKFTGERGEDFSQREQNLTWTETLGADNTIVAGEWWHASVPAESGGRAAAGAAGATGATGAAREPLVSLATEFQESLGIRLGDRLAFDVGGEQIEARVASIRKVKWDSFQPNFFIVFNPGVLDEAAGSYMTSAYFKTENARTLARLAQDFPGVSIFDIENLLTQVRSMADKAAVAVQSVFAFTLLAGLTVLLAAVQGSRDERRYESAMLRTLGASRRTVALGVLAEFTVLGALSGLLAALGASIAGYFVASRVLEVPYAPDWRVWLAGVIGGTALVAGGGWLATRSVVSQPPLASLRG